MASTMLKPPVRVHGSGQSSFGGLCGALRRMTISSPAPVVARAPLRIEGLYLLSILRYFLQCVLGGHQVYLMGRLRVLVLGAFELRFIFRQVWNYGSNHQPRYTDKCCFVCRIAACRLSPGCPDFHYKRDTKGMLDYY